jgi:hypothetical protein
MASTSRQVTCSFLGPDDRDITVDNARSLEDLKIAIAQQTGRDASLMILLNNVNGVQLTNGVLPAGLSEVTIQLMDLGLLPGMADTDEFRDKLYSFDVPIEKKVEGLEMRLEHKRNCHNLEHYFHACIIVRGHTDNTVDWQDWNEEFSMSSLSYKECDITSLKRAKYDLLMKMIQAYRELGECSRRTMKRRTMTGVDYCIGCVLTGLE